MKKQMCMCIDVKYCWCFPGGSDGKLSAGNAGALGLTPGLGRIPGGGHGNPLQYSCLEKPLVRGAWQHAVHRVTQSQTRLKQLSMHACLAAQCEKCLHLGYGYLDFGPRE